MALIWLIPFLNDLALNQEVCKPGHMQRVKEVNLKKIPISDIIAEIRYALDQSNMGDINSSLIIVVSLVAGGECMVDGNMQILYVRSN